MTGKHPLRRSGTRLQKHGALWFHQTRKAGQTFLAESKLASVTFAEDLKAAGTKLASTTSRSSSGLRNGVRKEILEWRELVLQRREAYVKAVQERLDGIEQQALGTREVLRLGTVETTVLQSTRELLERAQSLVDERLQQATAPTKPSGAKTGSKRAPSKKGQIPVRNYDQLTAKDLVSKVQKLSAPQASAVLDYELARKKRATVIRAIEQRLAAAS